MQKHSFPLTTSGWIPVWDRDAHSVREVGMTEALVRAHRLILPASGEDGIVLLRLLATALDAASGPATQDEWDTLWRSETLDADAVTAYMNTWAGHLDLLHPHQPAFQCAALNTPNRGASQLSPGALGGENSFRMFVSSASSEHHPGWTPAQAARHLLVLLAYDVAGIKTAAPGDPAAKGGKVYGAKPGALARLTHLHLEGVTLKDTLLLNLPPHPRATADAPVWERPSPGAHVRQRPVQGRLDWLTWPSRHVRLFTQDTDDGGCMVTGFAVHEGDRLPPDTSFGAAAQDCDPMTVWGLAADGETVVPQGRWLDAGGQPKPWAAARTLGPRDTRGSHCAVVDHLADVAERGILPTDFSVRAVMSTTQHATVHRSNVSGIVTVLFPLGTAGQFGSREDRDYLYGRAVLADTLTERLTACASRILRLPKADIATRLALPGLDRSWHRMIQDSITAPEAARRSWAHALYEAADVWIEEQPCRFEGGRDQLMAEYRQLCTP
ncbi:type I-E CRISPR-associated protein Cse1/CasA [Streptomyces sp. NPDC056304]|uniref:type I-E CRISPR-associated protein Cse1/CasA n=1 Tax=Streptomyces sp. NPDC056304 TaxID=3345778 RepID=UPI0035DE7F30